MNGSDSDFVGTSGDANEPVRPEAKPDVSEWGGGCGLGLYFVVHTQNRI